MILVGLTLAAAQPLQGSFRPAMTVSDVLSGVDMCRDVVTPGGIDHTPLQRKHWQTVKISSTNGDPMPAGADDTWAPPATFMMVMLHGDAQSAKCRVSAQVRDQSVVADVLEHFPVHLQPTGKAGELAADDGGQHVTVSTQANRDYPSINIVVSRPMGAK